MTAADPSADPSSCRRAWPFVITRAVRTGFTIVVAPDFLADVRRHSLLGDVAGGEVSQEHAYLREYRDQGSVRLWLLYRVVYLTKQDVGGDDSFEAMNRRAPLIEGVVCRTEPEFDATEELFTRVHELCGPAVRDFYTEDSDTFPVRPWGPLDPQVSGHALRIVRKGPYVSERNLQAALRGPHPRPLGTPAPAVPTPVPAAGPAGLGRPGTGSGGGPGALRDGQGGAGGTGRPERTPRRHGRPVVGPPATDSARRPAGLARTLLVPAVVAVVAVLLLHLVGVLG
ncbi:hypothetical protein [Streptomyces sp. NPDC021224]|uniref:hypothetical protein n=1 Tax=unclassified Streptomyces TaxID=2593676 RepID=UPI0037ACB027